MQKEERGANVFTHVLYPTDFSDTAGKSLAYLKALHPAGAQEVLVLHVIHQRILDTLDTLHAVVYFQDGRYQEDREKAERQLTADRKEKLRKVAAELEESGYEVRTVLRKGYPVREILKVEKEEEISVIVMGSHGRNNLGGTRIGSVSEKVVRRSASPVLLVKR